jgi:hypothetical protein
LPAAHTPALQTPLAHALLHEPQWLGLVARFAQSPAQVVRPVAHVAAQTDSEQTRPAPQAFPQAPQF